MSQRKRFDLNQPGARELADSIVHGAATTEGTLVAFPTCFPGVTIPVPMDESRITAMDICDNGMVYAGTSGYASHLLVGMFHGITGMVFDMGKVEGAEQCTAMCCGQKRFVAAVNGPRGSRLVARDLERLPFDLIQEWGISRQPYTIVSTPFDKEPIVHAVTDVSRQMAIGVTGRRLFTFDFASDTCTTIGDIPGVARLAVGSQGGIFGLDDNRTLWRFDPSDGRLRRRAVPLPAGAWDQPRLPWSRRTADGMLYTVDNQGRLFSFCEANGFNGPLATIPLMPVGAMAVTFDGRLFLSAGEGIARLFCFDPLPGTITDLGVAVSVIERRRYGYAFGDAVTGRDGEIVFGEDDNLGHLWLYFPRILPQR